MTKMRIRLVACVVAWSLPLQASAATKGNIPEGMWVLNQAKSKKLEPAAQTLWIVKDDGMNLAWVSVETLATGAVRITSWNGTYGGAAVEVTGSGFKSRITAPAPGAMHNEGEIPGLGTYTEDCKIEANRKRMICHGQVNGPNGPMTWLEDFDWMSKGPSTKPPHP